MTAKDYFTKSDRTAVFTTRFVALDKKPITYVTHESEDGAWQFFSDDNFDNFEAVVMVVALGEIIEMDSSILLLSDLPEGYMAYRESEKNEWIRKSRNSK